MTDSIIVIVTGSVYRNYNDNLLLNQIESYIKRSICIPKTISLCISAVNHYCRVFTIIVLLICFVDSSF